jgi:peptidoglycan/LPS O-acetylase OafA/YrhL
MIGRPHSPRNPAAANERVSPLDALRGLAALAVVVYHYIHFTGTQGRPLQFLFGPIYAYGNHAVPLFFILSGYIFFAVYSERIVENEIGVREFFMLRFSRLYPLHAVTLSVVAILQVVCLHVTGSYFVYRNNDALHFVFNASLLQFGWFPIGFSFNGPAWSISVEVGLYASFFAFCAICGRSLLALVLVAGVFLTLTLVHVTSIPYGPLHPFMSEGLGCFFLGGCLRRLKTNLPKPAIMAIGSIAILAGVSLAFEFDLRNMLIVGVFPGLILLAVSSERLLRASEFRPLAALGEISYSIYLWHFPVQLAFVIFAASVARFDFASPAVLWLYLATVFAAGCASYRYIEVPAKRAIRALAEQRVHAHAS